MMATKKETEKILEEKEVKENQKKMVKKAFRQETVEIAGEEYTFQFPGMKYALPIMRKQYSDDANEFVEELMDKIIVKPKTNWEYWDEHSGFDEVISEASEFFLKVYEE